MTLGVVGPPHRFRTKKQFWAYCGLAVVTATSAEYELVDGRVRRSRKRPLLRGLNNNYNRAMKEVFKGAAKTAAASEWICISGPSGVGKSSLLYTLAGLNVPISGRINITLHNMKTNGSPLLIHHGHRAVHLVPQNLPLLPQLNILDNVFFAQGIATTSAALDACRNLLIKVGLQDRLTFIPSQLSIGERQRVCVVRGLATNAPILLIDEPTSNLDGDCVSRLVNLFRGPMESAEPS